MELSSNLPLYGIGQHFPACLEPAYISHGDPIKMDASKGAGWIRTCELGKELPEIGSTLKAAASVHAQKHDENGESMTEVLCEKDIQSPSVTRGRKQRPKRRTALLIASCLAELRDEDPDKIVIVRKINRLGFASGEILRKYFERFGTVLKVHLSNSHNKDIGNGSACQIRLRPSGIAFVLFQRAEDATSALAGGSAQVIQDVEVFLRGFEVRQDEGGSPIIDENVNEEDD